MKLTSRSGVTRAAGEHESRVLQFCHGYSGPFLDVARQYAALFSDTGISVTTVFLTGAPTQEVERRLGSEVIFLGYESRHVRGLKLSAMVDLYRVAERGRFSLCIAHRFKPIYIACLATKLPIIGVHHAFGDYRRFNRRLFVRFFQERLHLLGVSNAVRDDIRHQLPGLRVDTLHNRVDIEALRREQVGREAARRQLGLDQNAWVVGNVGRLHPDKDQRTLLRGFARALPDLPKNSVLAIAGEGRLERELRLLAEELGISNQTYFLGQIPDARRFFKAFDVFALTSDHEPFGMVLLEAMAAGIPIVASKCGGAPEIVGETARMFPFADVDALASQLIASAHEDSTSVDQKRELAERMLTERFSDTAVRHQFTNLNFFDGAIDRIQQQLSAR